MSKRIARLTKPLVNRIVGHGEEAVDQLLANPLNYRLHPDNQQHALAGSIDDIGFIRSVTVNRRTGRVVDGHLRVTLAARSGVATLPVEYVDLSEAEEAQALLSLDPIAAMAASDREKLDELMRAIQSDDERVQAMLSEMAEREGLDFGKVEPPADPGAQVDKAEELRRKWGVESGQLWQLGDHRLICGDCADAGVVDRLMEGDKADMVFTDPPYNVGIVGGTHDPRSPKYQSGRKIDNDSMPDSAFDEQLFIWFSSMARVMRDGAAFYVCAPPGRTETQFRNALNRVSGIPLRQCIVWVKNSAVFGRQDYHWRHESILYGWKDGAAHYFTENRKQNTVWEVDRPTVSEFHPTMKPVELPEKAIENSSKAGWVIYDPFLGSGTTLIACERLGRKCRAVEISPAYVAVALERWATMTGQMPVLVN